jgi:IS5 family transposase
MVHRVAVTTANVAGVTQVAKLLHGEGRVVCADAGYTGVEKREEHVGREAIWQIVARCSTRCTRAMQEMAAAKCFATAERAEN